MRSPSRRNVWFAAAVPFLSPGGIITQLRNAHERWCALANGDAAIAGAPIQMLLYTHNNNTQENVKAS